MFNCGPLGFVKIRAEPEAAARFLKFRAAEQFADKFPHQRHPRLAADQNDLVQILRLQLRVGQRAQAMRPRAGNDVAREIFQFGARELVAEAEKSGVRNGSAISTSGFRGQFDFGLLRRLRGCGKAIAEYGWRNGGLSRLRFSSTRKSTSRLVQIIAAQPRVAVRGQHLKNALVQFQNRKVKRAAAQIINRDF